ARPHGVLRLRDRRDDQGGAASDRDDHLEQREGAARRVPAPLLLPLHQVPRARDDAEDRRRALSEHQAEAGQRGAERLLPDPRRAGTEEESDQADPAAARRPPQERAGRAPVRAPGVPGAAGKPQLTVRELGGTMVRLAVLVFLASAAAAVAANAPAPPSSAPNEAPAPRERQPVYKSIWREDGTGNIVHLQ